MKRLLSLILIICMLLSLAACSDSTYEPVPSTDEEKTVLLGKLTGGDDGYCPFNDGKYKVSFAGDRVTFSWSFDGSDTYSKTEGFTLPQNSDD